MKNPLKFVFPAAIAAMVLMFGSAASWAQTSTQNFGTGTATQTSQTGSTGIIPNPTSGTTWARAGITVPNAPIVVTNTGNPLGTSGAYVRGVASTSTSVSKFSPVVGYTGSTEFYTSFKVLFGDSAAGTTASSGSWNFYQGAGAMYSDANNFTGNQVFVGLFFTYTGSGTVTLAYRGGAANITNGLSATAFNQGTVYTIEIVGNNKTSGTISYIYNGAAQTVAVQKFDLYINGTLVGDDLAEAALPANTAINATTFIGISSTANAANIFVDDVSVYNAVPAVIGAAVPVVTASAASSLSPTDATLNGNVTSDGGSAILERGFVYKASSGVTIGDNKTVVAGTTGAFTTGLTSLGVNVQYFYRAYATNANGLTLSAETNFWTLANTPSAPTVGNPTATTLDVAIGAGDGNPAGTTYAIQETNTAKYVQADGSLNLTAVYQAATTWNTVTVSGLSPSTAYTFRVLARNGAGTSSAFGATATGSTSAGVVPPSVTTQSPTVVATTSATLNGTVTASNGAAIIDRGFYWKTTAGVTTADNQLSAGGTTVSSFSQSLGSLSVNTVHYYRAYAANSAGTNLDNSEVSFYTLANPPTVPTLDTITGTTMNITLGAGDGNSATTVYAIQETNSGSYVQANGTLGVVAVYQLAADWGIKTVTGLAGTTTYAFRVKARNGGGIDTAFSPVASGTTLVAAAVLAGWDMSGQNNYGVSPLAPSQATVSVTVGGLTRGSGVITNANATTRAWGGVNWTNADAVSAISAGLSATFTITPTAGKSVSFSAISKFDYRRSSTGPASGLLQYSTNGVTFTDLTTLGYSSSSSSGSSIAVPIDLTGVPALQNVAAGTTVTFRIVNYGATSSAGTWYVYDVANSTANDLEIRGFVTTTATISVSIAKDGAGNNVILTWPDAAYNLAASTNVLGPYTFVASTSPYTNAISGTQQFFRAVLRP